VSSSDSAALTKSRSRTVLRGKGSGRRVQLQRALASCAPFCRCMIWKGRFRREPDAIQSLRLAKDEDERAAAKTSSGDSLMYPIVVDSGEHGEIENKKPEQGAAPAWVLELLQAVSASMKFGHTDVSTT
jgi:hypothetical protein